MAQLLPHTLICMRRAGNVLRTRPEFIPKEALDDVSHWLPREAWAIHA